MKPFWLGLLLFSANAIAQDAIPSGTVLPLRLNSSLNSQKSRSGQAISARIMQDVPLSPHRRIREGARVLGRIVAVSAATGRGPAQMTLRFETLQFDHQVLPMSANLRALASMTEVEDAQVPPSGPDRGTPWAWTTRNLIGGEVAYGQGGPVARGDQTVGRSLASGVLLPVEANRTAGCRGDTAASRQLQALWVFSSDACGLYGFPDVILTHAGRSEPKGEITLASRQGNLNIRAGSGILLRVNSTLP